MNNQPNNSNQFQQNNTPNQQGDSTNNADEAAELARAKIRAIFDDGNQAPNTGSQNTPTGQQVNSGSPQQQNQQLKPTQQSQPTPGQAAPQPSVSPQQQPQSIQQNQQTRPPQQPSAQQKFQTNNNQSQPDPTQQYNRTIDESGSQHHGLQTPNQTQPQAKQPANGGQPNTSQQNASNANNVSQEQNNYQQTEEATQNDASISRERTIERPLEYTRTPPHSSTPLQDQGDTPQQLHSDQLDNQSQADTTEPQQQQQQQQQQAVPQTPSTPITPQQQTQAQPPQPYPTTQQPSQQQPQRAAQTQQPQQSPTPAQPQQVQPTQNQQQSTMPTQPEAQRQPIQQNVAGQANTQSQPLEQQNEAVHPQQPSLQADQPINQQVQSPASPAQNTQQQQDAYTSPEPTNSSSEHRLFKQENQQSTPQQQPSPTQTQPVQQNQQTQPQMQQHMTPEQALHEAGLDQSPQESPEIVMNNGGSIRSWLHKLPFVGKSKNTNDDSLPSPWKPLLRAVIVGVLAFGFLNSQIIVAQVKHFTSPTGQTDGPLLVDPSQEIAVGDKPRIIIPKINVNAPVVYDEKSFDEERVQQALQRGVVHYGTTALPGEKGNNVIVGHSSANWWDSGEWKFAFVLLDKLEIGDTFEMHYKSKRYVYRVTEKFITKPSDVSVLEQTEKPTATLITCNPPGSAWRRLIIKADQVSPDPAQAKQSKNVEVPESLDAELPSDSPTLFDKISDWIF